MSAQPREAVLSVSLPRVGEEEPKPPIPAVPTAQRDQFDFGDGIIIDPRTPSVFSATDYERYLDTLDESDRKIFDEWRGPAVEERCSDRPVAIIAVDDPKTGAAAPLGVLVTRPATYAHSALSGWLIKQAPFQVDEGPRARTTRLVQIDPGDVDFERVRDVPFCKIRTDQQGRYVITHQDFTRGGEPIQAMRDEAMRRGVGIMSVTYNAAIPPRAPWHRRLFTRIADAVGILLPDLDR